jgi:transposase InsO family protein
MKQDLALRALNMAIAIRRPQPGCVHHTDRGSQYCAHDYQKLLRKHGFKVSMSGKGNCYDNSAVESFFKSLKAELVWRRNWQTRREVKAPSSNTSTASTTRAANTQPSAGLHPWPSNRGPPNMST